MKKLKEFPLFKIAIITILIGALYILNNMSKNGRYLYANEGWIIDTRTGNMYNSDDHPTKGGWYSKPIFPKDHK